jgi:transketolase
MHHANHIGHLGGNLSVIDLLCLIYLDLMRGTDQLVLSKGHAAGALYVCMALAGEIDEAELESFHQNGTRLPGHPPANTFEKIAFATGSLGHGLSLASGMALAEKLRGGDATIFCVMGDGEWQEGSNWEAIWFAQHHTLSNLTIVVDQNELQGFGSIRDTSSMEDLLKRVRSHGIDCSTVDGHNLDALRDACSLPNKSDGPRAVFARTLKGKGVPWFEGEMRSHYVPLTDDAAEKALSVLQAKK